MPRGNRSAVRPFRPRFEALEDRLVPATHVWTGQFPTDNWDAASNWLNKDTGISGAPSPNETAPVVVQFSNVSGGEPRSFQNISLLTLDRIEFINSGNTITLQKGTLLRGGARITNQTGDNTITTDNNTGLLSQTSAPVVIDVQAGKLTISAVVTGDAREFRKIGDGTLVLSPRSASNYTNTTAVEAGNLIVNGDLSRSAVEVRGGTLSGSGTVGPLTGTGGTIAPARGTGFPAANLLTGSLKLGKTVYAPQLLFTNTDALTVTGTVDLTGSSLVPNVTGNAPPIGTKFRIIDNDGADAVTGTFADLAEGATLTQNGTTYQISYKGGDGNDVVLTAVDPTKVGGPGGTGPTTVLVGGRADGSAVVFTVDDKGNLVAGDTVNFGLGGQVRTATADVNNDGVADLIGAAGPGGPPRVVIKDGKTGTTIADFLAFEQTFTGGLYVAAGNMDKDGFAEVVVTPDQSGGPVVAVYDGKKLADGQNAGAQVNRFFGIQGDPNFRGGARATIGDVDGDGFGDLIISAGFLGGPRIAIFDGEEVLKGGQEPRKLVADFFAFEDTVRNGAFLTAGDVNDDGQADLAFGGGPNGGPRVRVFDGKKLLGAGGFQNLDQIGSAQISNLISGNESSRGGVRVTLRDVTGDGQADLVTGSGDKEASAVRLFDATELLKGNTSPEVQADPFGGVLDNGVFVG